MTTFVRTAIATALLVSLRFPSAANAQTGWATTAGSTNTLHHVFGGLGQSYQDDPTFRFIGGLRFGPDGNLYAAGVGNLTVGSDPGTVMRLTPQGYASFLGSVGNPTGLTVTDDGTVYVAGLSSNVVKAPSGVGAPWSSPVLSFSGPFASDMVFNGFNTIYATVSDGSIATITVSSGAVGTLRAPGTFKDPQGVTRDSVGNLVVSDATSGTTGAVSKVSTVTGTVTPFSSHPLLSVPRGLAYGTGGNLFVANADTISPSLVGLDSSAVATNYPLSLPFLGVVTYLASGPSSFSPPAMTLPEAVTYIGAGANIAPAGAVFSVLGTANRNSLPLSTTQGGRGRMAFIARLAAGAGVTPANDLAIYAGEPHAEILTVRKGDPAPGTPAGATFASFSSLVFNNVDGIAAAGMEEVAFIGVLNQGTGGVTDSNDTGIWSTKGGTLHLVAREGDIAPDTGGALFSSFIRLVLPDVRDVVFQAKLKGGTGSPFTTIARDEGIWAFDNSNTLYLVARERDPETVQSVSTWITKFFLADVTKSYAWGHTRGFSAATGDFVYLAKLGGAGNYAIYHVDRATDTKILVASRDTVVSNPAGAQFRAPSFPAINDNGTIAFFARLQAGGGVSTAGSYAIYAGPPGAFALVARAGDPAPGTGSEFRAPLNDPLLNNNDEVAFSARTVFGYFGSGAYGWWSTVGGSLHLVVAPGQTAPGTGGALFRRILAGVLPDVGDLVFVADLQTGTGVPEVTSANRKGVWATNANGAINLMVRTGDTFRVGDEDKIIQEIYFPDGESATEGQSHSVSADGNISCRVRFTDGVWAILRINRPGF